MKTITVDEYKLALANGAVFENKPRKKSIYEEDDLTKKTASYLDALKVRGKVLQFTHISNETFTKSWVIKRRNKAKGVRPGVPDMLIVYPNGLLFLELKREKGGVVSDSQKEWIAAINKADAKSVKVVAEVSAGWVKTKEMIDKYALLMSN